MKSNLQVKINGLAIVVTTFLPAQDVCTGSSLLGKMEPSSRSCDLKQANPTSCTSVSLCQQQHVSWMIWKMRDFSSLMSKWEW